MQETSIYQDIYGHNDWANRKVLTLCDGLTDEQLDQTKQMGFGTLRKTIFHLLEAESVWLDRWQGKPSRPLETTTNMGVAEMRKQFDDVAAVRNQLISEEQKTNFTRVADFKDSLGNPYSYPIGKLLNHVANHGVHHRAQALNYLRDFDKTVAGGLDYLFWKLAYPSCEQLEESLPPLREYGLEAATEPGYAPTFDRELIQNCFEYNDWAMLQVVDAALTVDDEQLDREFAMGLGTLRATLQHMIDAERWWLKNWHEADDCSFPSGEPPRSAAELLSLFQETSQSRNAFIAQLDDVAAAKIAAVQAGGPTIKFRVTESLLQLCCHGTHHRAQCLNMLRHMDVSHQSPDARGIDFIYWLQT